MDIEKINNNKNAVVRSMFISLLWVGVLSTLSACIASFVDSLAVSRYLGDTAVAAYSLAKPIFTFAGVFTGIIGSGLQIILSKTLSKNGLEKANSIFNTFFVICFIAGIAIGALLIGLAPQFAFIFGATDLNGELNRLTSEYVRGISIGMPFLFLYSALLPILTLNGYHKVVRFSAVVYAVIDITFDFLNVYIFKLGIFGIGLAGTIGYVIAVVPMIICLIRKKDGIHLSFKSICFKGISPVFVNGLSQGTKRLSTTLKSIIINYIMLAVGGTIALTASGVEGSVFSVSRVFLSPLAGILVPMTSIFFADDDSISMKHLYRITSYYCSIILGLLAILICIFAPQIVSVFKLNDPETIKQSIFAVRICIFGIPLSAVNNAYINYLQGTKQIKNSHLFTIIEFFVSLVFSYLLFGFTLGTIGLWIAVPAAEIFSFIFAIIYVSIQNKRVCISLNQLFGFDRIVKKSNIEDLSFSLNAKEDTATYTERIASFLKQYNIDENKINDVLIIFEHHFNGYKEVIKEKGIKPNKTKIDALIRIKNNNVIVRFRDDAVKYPPVERFKMRQTFYYSNKKDKEGKLLAARFKDIEVTPFLNIFNLRLIF